MKRFTLKELERMPTVHEGHFDNVKFDDGKIKVSLSRMTVADGMPYDNQVTVEKLIKGKWKTVDEYKAR